MTRRRSPTGIPDGYTAGSYGALTTGRTLATATATGGVWREGPDGNAWLFSPASRYGVNYGPVTDFLAAVKAGRFRAILRVEA